MRRVAAAMREAIGFWLVDCCCWKWGTEGGRVGLGRCVGWMDEGRVALVRRGWGGDDVDVAKD